MVSADKLEQIGLEAREVSEQARLLLQAEFYWSPVDDFSPFGNDDGSDAFHYFKEWRERNTEASPIIFVDELLEEWGYPKFDLTETDEGKVKKYRETESRGYSSEEIGWFREHFERLAMLSGKDFKEDELNESLNMASSGMGKKYLSGIDNAVIAVGFGQFLFEGTIEEDLYALVEAALNRELLPFVLDDMEEKLKKERKQKLMQMSLDLEKMKQR